MVESWKRLLSSQFVQVPDTPTNFHRLSMSRSTELAKALDPPSPAPPKRADPFQAFLRFLFPPSNPLCPQNFDSNWKWGFWDIRFFSDLSASLRSDHRFVKIWSPLCKLSITHFSNYPLQLPMSPDLIRIRKRLCQSWDIRSCAIY